MADTSLSSLNRTSRATSGTWLTKVPVIIAFFWLTKVATTAMGETTSDALNGLPTGPAVAIPLMLIGLVWTLRRQFRSDRYEAWTYWSVVVMVAIFGTSAADALHVGLGVPYLVSTIFYAIVLAVIFAVWYRVEGTLSIHSIRTRRREAFYWATVLATFALGTACGDMTATTLHIGYLGSGLMFLGLIAIPFLGHRYLGMNEVLAFWIAYVLTRPLGASFADWMAVEPHRGGLGLGAGGASLILAAVVFFCIRRLATTKIDVRVEDVDLEAEGSDGDGLSRGRALGLDLG
ncbi:MAG TPA: hypothetical protein VHA76_14960 [Solirubrobacterales bacterium]|nr:hypothetical protein [Solirubrobacterales bacterium]